MGAQINTPKTSGAAAPGACVDCGNDAYIRLARSDQLVCAHCYAERARHPRTTSPTPDTATVDRPAAS